MNHITPAKSLFLAIITVLLSTMAYAANAVMAPTATETSTPAVTPTTAIAPTEQATTALPDKATDIASQAIAAPIPQPTTVATHVEAGVPVQQTQNLTPQDNPKTSDIARTDELKDDTATASTEPETGATPITPPDMPIATQDMQENGSDMPEAIEPTDANNIDQEQIDKARLAEEKAAEELELQKHKEFAEQEKLRKEHEAKEKKDHELLEKALHETEAKEKAEKEAKEKAEKARLEQLERERNKPVSGVCAVSITQSPEAYTNNTKVAQAGKIVIKKFSANDKRSTGWKPLSIATIIDLNQTFATLGYDGFCKSPVAKKSALSSLILTRNDDQIPSTYYRSFERLIKDDVCSRSRTNELTYLSISKGNLYEDFIILNRLLQRGKTIKKVVLIDPTYQELIGQLTPTTSQKITTWKNHVAVAQLFKWFASAQKNVDFSVEIYSSVDSYRHDTSKTFPKVTPDIMVHCCANNPEHPNIEKYDIQGAIGSYWLSPCMQLEGMKEFVGVCVNHKKTDYGYLYNLKNNPTAKLSKMLKISKGETCLCNK